MGTFYVPGKALSIEGTEGKNWRPSPQGTHSLTQGQQSMASGPKPTVLFLQIRPHASMHCLWALLCCKSRVCGRDDLTCESEILRLFLETVCQPWCRGGNRTIYRHRGYGQGATETTPAAERRESPAWGEGRGTWPETLSITGKLHSLEKNCRVFLVFSALFWLPLRCRRLPIVFNNKARPRGITRGIRPKPFSSPQRRKRVIGTQQLRS